MMLFLAAVPLIFVGFKNPAVVGLISQLIIWLIYG